MSTTFHILQSLMPETLLAWISEMQGQERLHVIETKARNRNFRMHDIVIHDDADAVLFKLMFGNVAFTQTELNIINNDNATFDIDVLRLRVAKMKIYQKIK